MTSQYSPEIRCDDVLQTALITNAQRKDIGGNDPFELFLEIDKEFEKYNYPMTLAICAEGIIQDQMWVQHIYKNKHRYKIEVHCLWHRNHANYQIYDFELEMTTAIKMIEGVFDVKVTTWYPPFGRKGEREDPKDCDKLGIKQYKQIGKVDAKFWLKNPSKYPHVNFHFWSSPQVEHVNRILEICHLQQEPN